MHEGSIRFGDQVTESSQGTRSRKGEKSVCAGECEVEEWRQRSVQLVQVAGS